MKENWLLYMFKISKLSICIIRENNIKNYLLYPCLCWLDSKISLFKYGNHYISNIFLIFFYIFTKNIKIDRENS